MKSIFEGLLKLKFRSIKKDLSPAAVIFYPDGPRYGYWHLMFCSCKEFRG